MNVYRKREQFDNRRRRPTKRKLSILATVDLDDAQSLWPTCKAAAAVATAEAAVSVATKLVSRHSSADASGFH